jgi:hypothetical protein
MDLMVGGVRLFFNVLAVDAHRGALQMSGHRRIFLIVRCHAPSLWTDMTGKVTY